MGSEYLLDSNVIIGYLAGRIPASGMEALSAIVDQTPQISVISQIEVLRYNDSPENERVLSDFVASSIIYPLSPDVVRRTIAICKSGNIKLPDAAAPLNSSAVNNILIGKRPVGTYAIIAATALCEGFVLITRNIRDFKNIPTLLLLNPWEI